MQSELKTLTVSRGLLEDLISYDDAARLKAEQEVRPMLSGTYVDLDVLDWTAVLEAAASSTWMPQEYCRNEWVSDICSWLRDGPPRQKLEIEGRPSDGYDAWFTDSDGNLCTVVTFAHPFATADWCERNGFAWEIIGAVPEDVDSGLAEWRAQQ